MICQHKQKTNFAISRHSIQHEYCPECGWHKYRGKEYTKQEWARTWIDEDNKETQSESQLQLIY